MTESNRVKRERRIFEWILTACLSLLVAAAFWAVRPAGASRSTGAGAPEPPKLGRSKIGATKLRASQTERRSPSKPNRRATSEPVYTWYSGRTPKRAYASNNEVAVFFRPGADPSPRRMAQVARLLDKGAVPAAGSNSFVMFVRLPHGLVVRTVERLAAVLKRQPDVKELSPVFYPEAPVRTGADSADVAGKMALTGEVIVKFATRQTKSKLASFGDRYDLVATSRPRFARNTFIFTSASAAASLKIANALRASSDVAYASPNWLKTMSKRAAPDDPLYSNQWHLKNTGQGGGTPGEDVANGQIESVWDTYRGTTQTAIAVVDDGMETGHEDLSANTTLGGHWDWIGNDSNPNPGAVDDHGTAASGVAAARGFNTTGVTGVAPYARLMGYRLLGANTDSNEASAATRSKDIVDISSNSWGPADDRHLEGPGPLMEAALADGASTGRGGKGVIYVWAGGNGLDSGDDSNFDGYANSRYTIAVAASTNFGQQAPYSETGANLIVNAPSSSDSLGITTTDRTGSAGYSSGNYTSTFGGTSSAAPLVAGTVALMLDANPDLTWRDVQQILMSTATKNDPTDSDWTLNGVGYPVNHKYGFGRIDATAAVTAATTWTSAAEETSVAASSTPGLPIPDENPTGVSDGITIDSQMRVEYVDVTLSASNHTWWDDLRVELTSPSGTKSVLAPAYIGGFANGTSYDNWRFGTARHFGESSEGTWTLTVKDLAGHDTGTFQSWGIKIYGTAGTPVSGSFAIDNGASHTATTTASLDATVANATEMRYRNEGDPWPGTWDSYASTTPWTLPAGEGTKKVEAQYRDTPTGTVVTLDDTIILDTTTPDPPTNMTASRGNGTVSLVWDDPATDFAATRVLRSTADYAISPDDTAPAGQTQVYEGAGGGFTDSPVTNGETYRYTAFAKDPAGNWSTPATVSVLPVSETTIALEATKSSSAYGAVATLSASMVATYGPVTDRNDVTVWASPDGVGWSQVLTSTWNPATSKYEATQPVTAKTYFQFRFGGDANLLPSQSNTESLTSQAWLGYPWTSPSSPRRSRLFSTYGYLKPLHTGYTRLYFYRLRYGRWRYYTWKYAINYYYTATTNRYRLVYRLPYAGKWYVQPYHSDGNHLTTWGPKRVFWVR